MILDLIHKTKRKWLRLWYRPIRVYCQHHICAEFDKETMIPCDWMQIDEFKNKVLSMQQEGVRLISLTEAYAHICNDTYRKEKYAVITFDDGYASLKEILPWMEEHDIPAILFINGKYLDGKTYRHTSKEKYLTKDEVFALTSPLIEIGSHGWDHIDATKMSLEEYKNSVCENREILQDHPRYVPFYAYTYGKHTREEDAFLAGQQLIPVLVDGEDNYNDRRCIQRRIL